MVDDKIVGKYWLCQNKSGSLWLVQGGKPRQYKGSYLADYEELNLPSITYEDGPLGIEICKSGKVYWYES